MRTTHVGAIGLGLALLGTAAVGAVGPSDAESAEARSGAWGETPCSAVIAVPTTPGEYYAIDLVPTKRIPGTGLADGTGRVAFAWSPYGVAVSPSGHYIYDVNLEVTRLKPPRTGAYVAWITTPTLDEVRRLGTLAVSDGDGDLAKAAGRVDWNKFLLVVTLEPSDEPSGARWTGPVVMRGMSRSGLMHTLAGHGPFEQEPCQKYGYR